MGNADWPTTSKALDSLRDEIANSHTKFTKDKVGDAIIQALSLKADYKYKNDNPQVWIEGIQKFQDKTGNYIVRGSIAVDDPTDPTYNLLKCEVAKNLKITLKNPPAECYQIPNLTH
jgi:hypothetical protein